MGVVTVPFIEAILCVGYSMCTDHCVCGSYPGAVPWWAQRRDGESLQEFADRLCDSPGADDCEYYTIDRVTYRRSEKEVASDEAI